MLCVPRTANDDETPLGVMTLELPPSKSRDSRQSECGKVLYPARDDFLSGFAAFVA